MTLSVAFPAFVPTAAAQGTETCTESLRRFTTGPGRRPGATVVPVTLRLQVLNAEGKFVEASADRTRATVSGNDITLKAIVNNTSLYDVGNVVVTHSFKKPFSGSPTLEAITSVNGAFYNERINSFVIDTVPSDTAITFTFHILLSGDTNGGLSQSKITLEDFEVLEAERRLPERTPETPAGRSTQTIERVGIGGTDVACFTGDGVTRFLPSTATTPTSTLRRNPGPPYLTQTSGSTGQSSSARATPTSSASSSSPSRVSPPVSIVSAPLPSLTVEKTANTAEVRPGSVVTYTIVVTNQGTATVRDILVDDRFDARQLAVTETAGGALTPSGLQWVIATLAPGERWVVRYRAEVLSGVQPGSAIPNTVLLTGDSLLDVPTTRRSQSAQVSVLGTVMPQTGVDLWIFTLGGNILLGIVIAFVLFTLSLSSARFISRKWLGGGE